MYMTRQELLEKLFSAYSRWYTLTPVDGQKPLVAVGEFHEHGTGYIMVRAAEMWSADCNEYLYLFSMEHLDVAQYEECLRKARELGEPKIKPDKDHKSSYVTALFVCDTAEEEAIKRLKKCRIRKNFHFSLHGWMEVHTAVVAGGGETIATNGDGRRTGEFLKNVLHPRKKDLWYRLFKR